MRKDVLSLFLSATLICTMMPVEGATQFASAAEQNTSQVEAVALDQEEAGKITDSGTFGGEKNEDTGEVIKEDTHQWTFAESTGVLTISGEGDMPDYTFQTYTTAPWYQYLDKIKKVLFEGNVTNVADNAFRSYPALEEVDLTGAENLKKIGSQSFNAANNLKKVKGMSQLTEIDGYAFYSTALSGDLVLPNIETLQRYTFNGTKFTSISMPKLTTINGDATFYGCTELKTVNMPELTAISGNETFRNCTALTEVTLPKLTNAGNRTFDNCTSLKELSFPLLTDLGEYSLSNATSLQKVSLPMVKTIKRYTFQMNTSLVEVALPEATSLQSYAFEQCCSLQRISVPKLTDASGAFIFDGCSSLVFLELPEGVTSLGSQSFSGCDSLQRIYMKGEPAANIPVNVMKDGYSSNYLTDITIYVPSEAAKSKWSAYTAIAGEDKVQVVSDWTSLKKENDLQISLDSYDITSPATPAVTKNTAGSSVTYQYYTIYQDSTNNYINRFRLLNEENPTEAPTIPGTYYIQASTEESQGYYASASTLIPFTVYGDITGDGWVYNNKTTTLTITDAAIMDSAYTTASDVPWYQYRSNITKVAVKEGVTLTKIAPYAFYNFTNAEEIALPDSLDSVGNYAFYYCSKWNRTNTLTMKEVGSYSFMSCSNLSVPIILEEGATSVPASAFNNCQNIPSVQIPDTVTSFGDYCFASCFKITNIHIPEKVTALPKFFLQYTNIHNLTIPEGITSIDQGALGYTKITELTNLPASLTTLKPGAFQNMNQLQLIRIPATVTTIEGKNQNNYGLFANCKNLKTVIFDKTNYTTDTLGTCGAQGWYDTNQDGKNDGQFTVDQMFYNTNDTLKVLCDGDTYDILKSYAETNTYWQNWNQTKMGWTSSRVLCNVTQYLETYTEEETAAKNLTETDYKAELWSNLQTALTESKALAGTGETLYDKYMSCQDAIKLIQRAVRAFLQDTYQNTEGIFECDYYDAEMSDDEATTAWYTYVDAADSAKTLLTDELCSVEEYVACQQELKEAMSLIIPLPTDTAVQELEAVKAELASLKETDYTPESWKALQDAVSEADNMKEEGLISQIQAAQKKLEEAISQIVPLSTDTAVQELEAVKKELASLKETDYTPESWKVLQDAVSEADNIKEKGTISQIQAAQKKLEEAKSALIKATPQETPGTEPTQKPGDNPSPSPGTEPTKKPDNNKTPSPGSTPTQKPGNNNTTNKPSDNTNKKPSIKKVSVKKVVSKKKKTVVVQWKKLSGVSGYQIQLGRNKKFTKNKKTITVKKAKTVKKTVKKLKSKKKYYVRVRAYKTVKGKKYYGKWSKVKTVKIK